MNYLIYVGSFIVISTVLLYLYETLKNKRFTMDSKRAKKAFRNKQNLQRYKEGVKQYLTKFSQKEKWIVLVVTVLMASLASRIEALPKLLMAGLGMGLLIAISFRKTRMEIKKTKKIRDIAVLAESVELYVKSGYTIIQAIKTAKILTPSIAPELNKCLNYWAVGSTKALEQLEKDLGIKEAETIVSIMKHIEIAGLNHAKGILERESANIERLQKHKIQRNISSKPIYFMIYRILPFVSILGIVAGSLVYKSLSTLQVLNKYGF